MGQDLCLGQVRVLAHHDDLHPLAGHAIFHTDCRHFSNAGVQRHHVFDFIGVHVEARDQDQVLLAVDQADIAARIHHPDIAGRQPALGIQHLGGFLGPLPVALHHLRAAHLQFALLTEVGQFAVFAHETHPGRRQGHADAAGELHLAHAGNVDGADAHHRRAFGQPVAFDDRQPGDVLPALGHRRVRGHATGDHHAQVGKVPRTELLVLQQAVKQRVDPGNPVEALLAQDHLHALHVPWVGDQDVAPAQAHEHQAVHRQRKDVIQRQQGDVGFLLVLVQLVADPGLGLQQVGDDVAVAEHHALGVTGGAAGVLQEGQVVEVHVHREMGQRPSLLERLIEAYRTAQVEPRHLFLHAAQDEVHRRALEGAEQVADGRHHHALDAAAGHGFFQGVGEVLEDHHRLGAAVLEQMLEFMGGVQRVDVDHHRTGQDRPQQADRVLQAVGHHQRHAVAGLHTLALQPGGKRNALHVPVGIGHFGADADVGHPFAEFFQVLQEHLAQRRVVLDTGIDVRRDARQVGVQPDAFGVFQADSVHGSFLVVVLDSATFRRWR